MAIIRPLVPVFVTDGQACVYVTRFSEATATGVFYLVGDSLVEPDFRGWEREILIFNGTDYIVRERRVSTRILVSGETFEYAPQSGWIQADTYTARESSSGGPSSSITQAEVQAAVTAALQTQNQVEYEETFLVDDNGDYFVRRTVVDEETGVVTRANFEMDGVTPKTVIALPVKPAASSGFSAITTQYEALFAGSGLNVGDQISRTQLVSQDGSVLATVWQNETTGTPLATPPAANALRPLIDDTNDLLEQIAVNTSPVLNRTPGATISNQISIFGFNNDSSSFLYDLDQIGQESDGAWISFVCESATGETVTMVYNYYGSANSGAFGTNPIYNEQGILISNDAVFNDGQRYWFKAANCGRQIIFTPDPSGNISDYFIATHLSPPFVLPETQQLINLSSGISVGVNNLIQNNLSNAFNTNSPANTTTDQPNTITINSQSNTLELATLAAMPNDANFYIEVRFGTTAQWRVLSWLNLSTGQRTFTINTDGVYRANLSSVILGQVNINWRIVNIGTATLNASLLGISTISGIQPVIPPAPAEFTATLVSPIGTTSVTLLIPDLLKQRKPKSLNFSAHRPLGTTISDRTELRLGYLTSLNKSSSPTSTLTRVIDFEYSNGTAGGNYMSGTFDKSSSALQPMDILAFVRSTTTVSVNFNVILEY